MKLILIRGNSEDAILRKISEIKKNFDPLSINEILEGASKFDLTTPSLFSNTRLLILHNPEINIIDKAIALNDSGLTVLVKYKGLEKSSPVLKKFLEAKGEVLSFDETTDTPIFPFLDMLGNLNKKAFSELEKNYSDMGGQYILTMLAYFLRRMVAKPKSSSDFMRQKIEAQKKNFSLERIQKLYKEIIETDFKIKQGLLEERFAVTLLIQKILSKKT